MADGAMMAFHEVRFPADLSFGSVGGPEWRVEIVTLASGHERRNLRRSRSRRRYDAGLGVRSLDDLARLIAFFEARRGPLCGFRWKDWSDWHSAAPSREPGPADQFLGTGDGARMRFDLVKRYVSGGVEEVRRITKPVAGTVSVALSGDRLVEGVHYEVDTEAGAVVFAEPPGAGAEVTAGFAFDVPVRFDAMQLEISAASFAAGEVPSVPVVEILV